ncbi:MAG: hypothetical protein N3F08_05075 [Crenarchaeota archaeon]|nr:hypothetical protein [Thermoproteota archaeon]
MFTNRTSYLRSPLKFIRMGKKVVVNWEKGLICYFLEEDMTIDIVEH